MRDFVGADIASLGKFLMAYLARVRLLASVSSFMSLKIPQLRKPLATRGFLACKRLVTGMCPHMDIKMCLLEKALLAMRESALVFPFRFLVRGRNAILRGVRENRLVSTHLVGVGWMNPIGDTAIELLLQGRELVFRLR
ncbi:hypothetical protein ACKS0A_10079 [Histoplasma ohiense]